MEIHVTGRIKGPERYVVMYTAANRVDAIRQLGRWASNPELSFSWRDVVSMSKVMRKQCGYHYGDQEHV